MSKKYEPMWSSIDTHSAPDWYHDAKLGIFIHWGLYSVPAWAPIGEHYAEWYPYYMYDKGSSWYEYHREHYGEDVEYIDFAGEFTAENWDPDEWAEFFADVGAGYVVLTGEHHDGFALWDSHYTKYNAVEMGPERDLVGDLAASVRDRDMKFAASYHANLNYYQPGFEGRFGHPGFEGAGGDYRSEDAGPGPEYVDFMNAKHRELIRKYEPDLLWFDVPCADSDRVHAREIIADYYNAAAEWDKTVAVNDRAATDARGSHADFSTPEYETYDEISEDKWEACRGLGFSFGYNAAETEEDHLTAEELIQSFVDIVSKNGNLLINVGPKADGTIPDLQKRPLTGLGTWLDTNGEAIYGTTYWATSEDSISDVEVRYTWKDETLYAICLDWPTDDLVLGIEDHVDLETIDSVELLDGDLDLDFDRDGDFSVALPEDPPTEAPAYAIRISDVSGIGR
ncbi:alpha-L-fucosidase [Haladaptatus pallidirubidus]|uniref:alpha-L-fucosidase n=1 Tax=Haladaptatus pallidirubidus TaxID=1008152 RepID=A0AAV3UP85_9EURY|nr:alpha-L-fucosidase [Haladaptatus pallidirubidus]